MGNGPQEYLRTLHPDPMCRRSSVDSNRHRGSESLDAVKLSRTATVQHKMRMSLPLPFHPAVLLTGVLLLCGSLRADPNSREEAKSKRQAEAKVVLEKWKTTGVCPDG